MSYVEQVGAGNVVWAKMNSFPYWPARVATKGEAIAENLKLTVGKSGQHSSSSSITVPNIEKDYTSEALEKARTYCNDRVNSRGEVFVNFFGSFDYAWVKREGTKRIIPYEMNSEQSKRLRKSRKSKPFVVAMEDADQYCLTGVFIRTSDDWFQQLESRRQFEEKEKAEKERLKEMHRRAQREKSEWCLCFVGCCYK